MAPIELIDLYKPSWRKRHRGADLFQIHFDKGRSCIGIKFTNDG